MLSFSFLFVSTDHQVNRTKSLASMSSPDAAHRLPNTDDTNRREKKNAGNANLHNGVDKFSERKKVLLPTRLSW
jgi:hypothetical protein